MPLQVAKREAAKLLNVAVPTDAEFNAILAEPTARKRVGRPPLNGLTRSAAVAALAVYFRSIGARPEQSLVEAKRWLNVSVSRKVALKAIEVFKVQTDPVYYRASAMWAYQKIKGGTTLPLPEHIDPAPRKRRAGAKFELG